LTAERQRQSDHCCERQKAAKNNQTTAPQPLPSSTPAGSRIEF
jgi:hypothetical protein